MTRVITVASSKGGVGKTTVAVNLAAGLASLGRFYQPDQPFQVLLVDLDPSCNAISTVGFSAGHLAPMPKSLVTLLKQSPPPSPQPFIKQSDYHPNLFFIPSMSMEFADFTRDTLKDLPKREERLARALRPILDWFEFIIIDTPASSHSSYIFSNAFMVSTDILIAVEPESLSVSGMQNLVAEINRACQNLDREVPVLGIVPTRVKKRGALALGFAGEINARFQDLVTSPSHMTERIATMYTTHKDLFATAPRFWEKRAALKEDESDTTPVGEFGTIVIELLTRMGYEI